MTDPATRPLLIAAILIAMLLLFGVFRTYRERRAHETRRAALRSGRLSLRERVILEKALPWMRHLPQDLRIRLEGAMNVFLAATPFHPAGTLNEVSDEMRLVVAAQACLLVVNRPRDYYTTLNHVFIHPTAFHSPVSDTIAGDVELVELEERLGESGEDGTVILAWDSVLRGSRNHEDGLNVVLHEFAHQLDQENGPADGAPILERAADYRSWSRVFHAAYGKHVEASGQDRDTVLDDYGAEHPAEFFAVATETFFERPHALAEEYPELFLTLLQYYRLDPRQWKPSGTTNTPPSLP